MTTNFRGAAVRAGFSFTKPTSFSAGLNVEDALLAELVAFKRDARKDDPSRLQEIYGPYEIAMMAAKGRLPADWYEPDDPEPWGMRVAESRSNILWQSISGIMDRYPQFAAEYLSLGLDTVLSDADYVKELRSLNAAWKEYGEHEGMFKDHRHSAMGHIYRRVACPGCSLLAAMAHKSPGMQKIFQELLPLSPQDRRAALAERGLLPMMNKVVPDTVQEFKFMQLVAEG
jgi:hypothetical protein